METKRLIKIFGIALIGVGRAGTIHFNNCLGNRRVHLRYLIDYRVEKCKEYIDGANLTETKALAPDQLQTALDDVLVDGVIIATVTSSHEELILMSLNAGKAVFCEKPLAETCEGTEGCYNLAESSGLPLFCAFNRRFDPTHSKVRDQVKAGTVGQVQVIKTCSRDSPFPPIEYLRASHGIFHDCGIHDADLIMWILGEKPNVVSAFGHAFNEEMSAIGDVDTVAITLKFPSGTLAMIDLSRLATYGYDQRLEVFGSQGMLQSKNPSKSSVAISDKNGISDDVLEFSFDTRYADAYKLELSHFLDSINGHCLSIGKDDTLAACRVAQACEDSFRSGLPVKLKWL